MINDFWHHLPKPFFVLAPMDAVTDTVFRHVVAKAAPADLYFTEFASTDGYCHPKGRANMYSRLLFGPDEGPLVAQIWGTNPEHFAEMAQGLKEMGYLAIDINMGCPAKDVIKKGAGSALIENPELAAEIIAATKTAGLPVSVKTRIGFRTRKTEEWLSFLLRQDIAALTVHARTMKEMSKVPAHWEEVATAGKLRNEIAPHTLIIGNGDVANREGGLRRIAETGADGIMIGRGVFTDVFCFEHEAREHAVEEQLALLNYHLDLFDATWRGERTYHPLKRFFKVYINGFPGASELREQLMSTSNTSEARQILTKFAAQ
jgi:tRNA-dihydrouridine synthase